MGLKETIKEIGKKAKKASFELAMVDDKTKSLSLISASKELMRNKKNILSENKKEHTINTNTMEIIDFTYHQTSFFA